MTNNSGGYTVNQYPIKYDGNIVWPILFFIVFFPIGILLIILNTAVRKEGVFYQLKYLGSEGWLIFWTVIFFPVAIILAALNGFNVIAKDETSIIIEDNLKKTDQK